MTYLITFACYGCHLHGDESGTVDRCHNLPGSPMLAGNTERLRAESRHMDQPAYGMDAGRRRVVLTAIQARCLEQNWTLMAAHARTNHVHVVVEAGAKPERIMNDLKSYASRCLNHAKLDDQARKRWARHGSTRWLWKRESVSTAIRYVIDEQGEAMAAFEA